MSIQTIKGLLRPIYGPILGFVRASKKKRHIKVDVARVKRMLMLCSPTASRIFYLGITSHTNLGDMGQYYCIHNWILANYPNHCLIEIEADTVVRKEYGLLDLLCNSYREGDIVLFQSGYTTQDLGGVHDLMHRMVIEAIPDARILMMPQTIFFQHEINKQRSAAIYNKAHNMLFLARDKVSYATAKEMMPDVRVRLFPDIVTSLIGKYDFDGERNGISLCRRNDGEKYYSEEELAAFAKRFDGQSAVIVSDTTISVSLKNLRNNPQKYIERQIEYFSRFEVVVTDRYHGTIYALSAGTPVVIIKTTDHKVVTGADWFKGVYDDYIYVAANLNEAYNIVCGILQKPLSHRLPPVFATQYYSKLKDLFENQCE